MRPMKISGAIWSSVAVLALTACSSGSAGVSSSPTETPTPTPTAAAASVNQWASAIAKLKQDYDNATSKWQGATCSSLAVADGAVDCLAMMTTMTYVAQTTQITLDGLQQKGGPTYLGGAPNEVSMLLKDTTAAAAAASSAGTELACPGDQCVTTSFQFERAWDDLGEQFAGWAPYL